MNETPTATTMTNASKMTEKGYTVIRRLIGIWGAPEVLYSVVEPSSLMGNHGTIESRDGQWFGTLTSRRIPKEIEILPQGAARWAACDAWRAANRDESYAAILEAFPEASEGERDRFDGTIRVSL